MRPANSHYFHSYRIDARQAADQDVPFARREKCCSRERNFKPALTWCQSQSDWRMFGTPLAAAAALGLTHIVHLLLKKGASPSSYGGRLGSALQAACAHGELPVEWLVSPAGLEAYETIIGTLIGAGCSVDQVGGRYGTALQAAAWFGDLEAVRQLLRAGCDHSIVAGNYGTALDAARSEGHAKVVEELIQVGANPRTNASRRHENDDWTTWRDIPVASMFLKYGAPLPSVRLP